MQCNKPAFSFSRNIARTAARFSVKAVWQTSCRYLPQFTQRMYVTPVTLFYCSNTLQAHCETFIILKYYFTYREILTNYTQALILNFCLHNFFKTPFDSRCQEMEESIFEHGALTAL